MRCELNLHCGEGFFTLAHVTCFTGTFIYRREIVEKLALLSTKCKLGIYLGFCRSAQAVCEVLEYEGLNWVEVKSLIGNFCGGFWNECSLFLVLLSNYIPSIFLCFSWLNCYIQELKNCKDCMFELIFSLIGSFRTSSKKFWSSIQFLHFNIFSNRWIHIIIVICSFDFISYSSNDYFLRSVWVNLFIWL